ncbi:MAG: UDP-N-acetylmuramoyl-L-alanyl-D-glutamate--2,6-diaminopimelate ligase, partial [Nitrospira sp.]|nr:UDP-N-acetylmuramoyl-L-alanyl-D-glutamate--2,6-diaminopimelate ligase [Nitrospira sp.]
MTFATMLQALEGRVPILERRGDLGMAVKEITDDSRTVSNGSLFVAVKGERVDGHQFVPMALSRGAGGVVAQHSMETGTIPFVCVEDSRRALGFLGSRFYGDPSSRLRMVGVTGTNGKTTTTYVCKAFLEAISARVGVIG